MPTISSPQRITGRNRYVRMLGIGLAIGLAGIVLLLVWRTTRSEPTNVSNTIAVVDPGPALAPEMNRVADELVEAKQEMMVLKNALPLVQRGRPATAPKRDGISGALHWLARHQGTDGRWSADYTCIGSNHHDDPEVDHLGVDGEVARTALALLCFAGAGYNHRLPGKFRHTTKAGLDWLIARQQPDGRWGGHLAQALATMALAEFASSANDSDLGRCAQRGVDSIIARQYRDPDGLLLGWANDENTPTRMDAWTSVLNVSAVKSARAAGLQTGASMEGARVYVERAWRAANRMREMKDPYTDTSTFPAVWDCVDDTIVQASGPMGTDLTAPAALATIFLGFLSGDLRLDSMANHVMLRAPRSFPCDLSDLYFGTLAMFQLGGSRFEVWNRNIRDLRLDSQRREPECLAGSWDGGGTFGGEPVGRMFSTMICCLSLEIYYAYTR